LKGSASPGIRAWKRLVPVTGFLGELATVPALGDPLVQRFL